MRILHTAGFALFGIISQAAHSQELACVICGNDYVCEIPGTTITCPGQPITIPEVPEEGGGGSFNVATRTYTFFVDSAAVQVRSEDLPQFIATNPALISQDLNLKLVTPTTPTELEKLRQSAENYRLSIEDSADVLLESNGIDRAAWNYGEKLNGYKALIEKYREGVSEIAG